MIVSYDYTLKSMNWHMICDVLIPPMLNFDEHKFFGAVCLKFYTDQILFFLGN